MRWGLGLATPTAIIVGTGQGARAGILFGNTNALEQVQRLQVLVLDKTGTITEGKPSVSDVLPEAAVADSELLRVALSLEQHSEHPLGQALVQHARDVGVEAVEVSVFQAVIGRAVKGKVAGENWLLGSPRFLAENDIVLDQAQIAKLEAQGKTVIAIARADLLLGYIALADKVRDDARTAIADLQH